MLWPNWFTNSNSQYTFYNQIKEIEHSNNIFFSYSMKDICMYPFILKYYIFLKYIWQLKNCFQQKKTALKNMTVKIKIYIWITDNRFKGKHLQLESQKAQILKQQSTSNLNQKYSISQYIGNKLVYGD